ncbi:MAG: hypothetical protein DMG11_26645 [Acidobacteria bacterium]|nr:MAG: hypothetical protein DMG11_26645 [Acidobacteriota bacterium]
MRVDSRKFLSVGVLLLVSTLAVNGASSRESAIVKDVSYQTIGDSLEVKITATGDSKFTYFELNGPHRLVVDFHGIQNTIGFKEKQIDANGVERVRTSFFNDKNRQATRIVFDLKDNVQYRVVDDGGGSIVRIVFGATAHAPSNLTAGPPVAPAESVATALKLPTVKLDPGLFQAEPRFELPQLSARPVVQLVQNASPQAVAAVAQVPPPAIQGQTQITILPPTPPQVPATTPTPIPQYNGELISLDLKDYDIKDFFRLISELSGLNVVLDPNVMGTITLKMIEVPWDQALDVVLKNYQLGGQLQGNVLRIATNATLQAEEGQRKALRDAQDLASPLTTRTFVLNYTKAVDVATTMARLLSPRGTIIQDARKNALIVTDIPTQFTKLDDLVRFLDTPQQQVEIEARLLSAVKSFSKDLGNQLGLLIGNRSGNVLTGVPGTSSPFARIPPPRVATGAGVPLVANFPAGGTSGLSFLLQAGGDILLDEIITAAEARGQHRCNGVAGYTDPRPDQRQQHDFGPVHQLHAEPHRDTADHRRRYDSAHRWNRKQPAGLCASGQRNSFRIDAACANATAAAGWRYCRNRRHSSRSGFDQCPAGSRVRQRANHWNPVQEHADDQEYVRTALLYHAAHPAAGRADSGCPW